MVNFPIVEVTFWKKILVERKMVEINLISFSELPSTTSCCIKKNNEAGEKRILTVESNNKKKLQNIYIYNSHYVM